MITLSKGRGILAGAAMLAAMFALSPAAHADNIVIGVQDAQAGSSASCLFGTNSGAGSICVTTFTPSGTSAVQYSSTSAGDTWKGFNSVTASGSGAPATPEPGFGAQTLSVSSTAPGTMTIYVLDKGLTFPGPFDMLLSFSNSSVGVGSATASIGGYFDPNNGDFNGTNTGLASTFQQFGSSSSCSLNTGTCSVPIEISQANVVGGAQPFSLAAVFTINATSAEQQFNLGLTMFDVPEPSSLLMLGSALLALGGIFWFRRRKIEA